ncbi:hypothetical protein HO173_009035 [Letharia columbiana]|uniref:Ubiquitin-like domain-containing protein n=1 Tax=Letharia columbiana TaxID=112416 RepID=A0A8H6L274_9LECA|nr:uncharacterized protein HO173_009035 [Letharia columbiana]KAF6232821.1 hypothetical protein HO173_009035 [Letharia columbiana]
MLMDLTYNIHGSNNPIKIDDALGRILPVPSEYNLWKINAIVLDQFKVGSAHEKVSCGEYELFNGVDSRQPLSDSGLGTLVSGMSITMAFVIGLYEQQPCHMQRLVRHL